eukprot:6196710-Pleurochrysis_carterae.AAC.1
MSSRSRRLTGARPSLGRHARVQGACIRVRSFGDSGSVQKQCYKIELYVSASIFTDHEIRLTIKSLRIARCWTYAHSDFHPRHAILQPLGYGNTIISEHH